MSDGRMEDRQRNRHCDLMKSTVEVSQSLDDTLANVLSYFMFCWTACCCKDAPSGERSSHCEEGDFWIPTPPPPPRRRAPPAPPISTQLPLLTPHASSSQTGKFRHHPNNALTRAPLQFKERQQQSPNSFTSGSLESRGNSVYGGSAPTSPDHSDHPMSASLSSENVYENLDLARIRNDLVDKVPLSTPFGSLNMFTLRVVRHMLCMKDAEEPCLAVENRDLYPRRGMLTPKDLLEVIKPDPLNLVEEIGEHVAQVLVYVAYSFLRSRLTLRLMDARQLPESLTTRYACLTGKANFVPYVRAHLLPYIKAGTSESGEVLRRRSCYNYLDGAFTFKIPFSEMKHYLVQFIFFDLGTNFEYRDIGQLVVPLNKMQVNMFHGASYWRTWETVHKFLCDTRGEVAVSLCFLPNLEQLNVCIVRARRLLQIAPGSSWPYVRVALILNNKVIKTGKAFPVTGGENPVFHKLLSFNVKKKDVENCRIVVTVLDRNGIGFREQFVGRAILGDRPTSDEEKICKWCDLVKHKREPIVHWHCLLSSASCESICPATKKLSY